MKTIHINILAVICFLLISQCSSKTGSETLVEDEKAPVEAVEEIPPSPRKEAIGVANGVNIVVYYGSPAVKGRKIWGGLTSKKGENTPKIVRTPSGRKASLTALTLLQISTVSFGGVVEGGTARSPISDSVLLH